MYLLSIKSCLGFASHIARLCQRLRHHQRLTCQCQKTHPSSEVAPYLRSSVVGSPGFTQPTTPARSMVTRSAAPLGRFVPRGAQITSAIALGRSIFPFLIDIVPWLAFRVHTTLMIPGLQSSGKADKLYQHDFMPSRCLCIYGHWTLSWPRTIAMVSQDMRRETVYEEQKSVWFR